MSLEKERRRLHAKLQKALELELSTIPPYLTANFSLHPGKNTEAAAIIRSVFMEEMLHMTLAANLLAAVDGRAKLGRDHIPVYPLRLEFDGAPFHDREVDIHLARFSSETLLTFLQIELPANFPPAPGALKTPEIAVPGFTIGEFYAGIKDDLAHLCREHGEKAVFCGDRKRQVSEEYYWSGGGRPIKVVDLASANKAIDVICDQGEGADGTILDDDRHFFGQPEEVAHYFRFNEIYVGRRYRPTDHIHDAPSGAPLPVDYNAVYPLKPDCKAADFCGDAQLTALNDKFNFIYSLMLAQLEEGFGGNPAVFYTAIMNGMHGLPAIARTMVQLPIPGDAAGRHAAPSFEWNDPSV